MVLDEQRKRADFALTPVAKKLINVNPNMISWGGLILAFLSGLLFYFSYEYHYLLIVGAVVVLISGYFDALDGKIAKLAGKASSKGDYLDHVFDRYADVFMIGGVAVSAWCDPYIGLLALVGVLLTSYMGTQAQAIGAPRLYAGLLGRADRVVLSTLFPIIQFIMIFAGHSVIEVAGYSMSWMEIMMIWFAVVGNFTAVQRGVITWTNLSMKKDPPKKKEETPQKIDSEILEASDIEEEDSDRSAIAANDWAPVVQDLTNMESRVYKVVCEGKVTTAVEISNVIGVSDKTVRRALAKLIEKGYVKRVGGDKMGKWVPVSGTK